MSSAHRSSLAKLLLLLLVAAPSRSLAAGSTPATRNVPTREIPFEITSNKPFVQLRVNDSGPRWFILDTGCRYSSLIARRCAEELGLKLEERDAGTNMGAGEGQRVTLATTKDVILDVQGEILRAPELPVVPLDHVEPYEGRRIDGLLGQDFMEEHVVELDYGSSTMRLYDPQTFRYTGDSRPIPVTVEDGLMRAPARMVTPKGDTLDCHVVVDTGVRGLVIWYHPFVLAERLLASQERTITGTIGGGVGGETRGDIGRLASLTLGPFTLDRPTAIFSRDTTGVFAGTDADGIVGGELLRRCRVFFDYPGRRLILEPYADSPGRSEYDMSGLFLVSELPALNSIRVQSVAEGSPASEVGLEKGDRIVKIDGRGSDTLTLDEVREMFRHDGKQYRLDIARGAQQLSVRLALRRLV